MSLTSARKFKVIEKELENEKRRRAQMEEEVKNLKQQMNTILSSTKSSGFSMGKKINNKILK